MAIFVRGGLKLSNEEALHLQHRHAVVAVSVRKGRKGRPFLFAYEENQIMFDREKAPEITPPPPYHR